jgi:MoxR-like ATPase
MKKLEVSSLNIDGKIATIEHIFDNMHAKASGLMQAGYLLGGDTGVGKTSFVRDFSVLLGLEMVIIETPHIVEEHIIDIPFIVVRANTTKTQHMMVDTKGTQAEFDIKFAKSNLHSTLTQAKKIDDATLLQSVYRRPDLVLIWEKLGGTTKKIPNEIVGLRKRYEVILFLDEYFRQTSNSIRNMLRSILNGRIGSHEIPSNVYVIFASNLVDQGVGDVLENEDFHLMNFDTPSIDEWFAYILTKYKGKMDDDLIHRFYNLLKKNKGSLSLDDVEADVRVSPRRWEQLLVYINAALPVKNERDAALLLKNVEVNFKNYVDGAKAEIAKDVITTVQEMVKERQDISASPDSVDEGDWRDVLEHQIATRIKAGNARKYIPVIGGKPGAGKTKFIHEIAVDLNLVPVVVDVQTLSPEEVIGVPLAKKGESNDDIEVTFARPPLYDYILGEMKKGEANLKERLSKLKGDEGKKQFSDWQKADVKFLIFFDELNRTNTKVFNAIRKVLLEKEFNDEYKLPAEAVIVAAINPTGKGTVELTKHVRDVFDVIPVGVRHEKFKAHIDKSVVTKLKSSGVDDESITIAVNAQRALQEHFRVKGDKIDNVDPHFYLNVGPTPVYVSGREWTDMLVKVAFNVNRAYNREIAKMGDSDADAGEAELKVRTAMSEAFQHSLNHIIGNKNGIDAPEFMRDLDEWIKYSDKISLGDAFKKKVESVKTLSSLLDKPFDKMDDDLFNDIEFVNYIQSVDPVVFKEQLVEFLVTSVINDTKKVFDKTHKKKELKGAKTKVTDKEVARLEFISREILHAIKLHDISNKMVEMVKLALREALIKVADADSDLVMNVMTFSRELTSFIKSL